MDEMTIVSDTSTMTKAKTEAPFDTVAVGRRLDAVRMAHGLSQDEFANSVGINPSSYSRIKVGDKPLNANQAFRVAERWSVTMDYLYRGRFSDLPESIAAKLRSLDTHRQQ